MCHPIFLEVEFTPVPEGWADILIAELTEIGFDGFSEEGTTLLAYIREEDFNELLIHEVIQKYPSLRSTTWSVTKMPDKNWNEVWESSYDPVLIAGKCYIRAPFHPPLEAMRHEAHLSSYPTPKSRDLRFATTSSIQHPGSSIEIIIEPKMSFGTAHHDTTSLMIEALLEEEVAGQDVLDMGCGTGVLAILASRMGASSVVAIDHDERAVENTLENIAKNNTGTIDVIQGDASGIPEDPYDMILANINRNTLIGQIPAYAKALRTGGRLLMSGFYTEDLPVIEECAAEHGLSLAGSRTENNWMAAKFNR